MPKIKPGPKGPHKDPELKKVPFNTVVPLYLSRELKKEHNQAALIERLLLAEFKMRPPTN